MNIILKGDKAIAMTTASPRLLAILPRLEGRRSWLKSGGLSFEATAHNLEIFTGQYPEANIGIQTEPAVEWGEDVPATLAPYSPKTQPYDHQAEALAKMRGVPAFALFMEQGTGKTKVAIDRAGELWASGKITGVLVVSRKGVHRQWIESEVPTHFGGNVNGEFWPLKSLPDSLRPGADLKWFSINFDGVKTPKGKAAAMEFLQWHHGKVMIVADETQEIKNARSARHTAMEELKRASGSPYRLALTGTPIAKDLTDEWAQLKWLNEDIIGVRYITAFRNEYCLMGGFEGRVVVGHKNVDRLKAKVEPHSFRATKDQIGILPKGYKRWSFDLTLTQRSAIRDLRKELLHQIGSGEIVSAANAAVAMVKIQQISNGFVVDEDGNTTRLMSIDKNPRLNALAEYLESRPGRIIIWARFREDIKMIAERLEADGVSFVEYHGGTSDKQRAEAVKSFMDPFGARVFLSNPQAGGTGLNLQGMCRDAIYYSNSYNAVDRWQSEDRIHRIGTNGVVTYTDLIAKGSIDAAITANLRRKKGISEMALGDIQKILEDDEWA